MAFCTSCGTQLPLEGKFCVNCGVPHTGHSSASSPPLKTLSQANATTHVIVNGVQRLDIYNSYIRYFIIC